MNKDQQQKAILLACGWRLKRQTNLGDDRYNPITVEDLWLSPDGIYWPQEKTPDYLKDLNAMRMAILTLDVSQSNDFVKWAEFIAERDAPRFEGRWWRFHMINATCSQRAEAFLRAVGKWAGTDAPNAPASPCKLPLPSNHPAAL